jgi:mRNA interferase RelE/StbE
LTSRRWRLAVAASAERTLARLPEKAAVAVVEFMLGPLCDSPKKVGHRLGRELEGLWGARRGPYGIVFELDEETRHVLVLRIEHRADVYRPPNGSRA